ncbi:von Willebrand factor type A domain protein [Stieleria varia]|uniref:von Willebrand factor type A domain protein n=2 Tax=Stieleria varia TaxID=2528005 RepID=A0A5C5ZY55_9BACT|nr:von Willebrand factor type A domain protein [Stieleria varia]
MVAVVALLPLLFILAAMVINLSYIQMISGKAQIVTDIAARAAGRAFVETGSESAALAAAQTMAELNPIQSSELTFAEGDLEFGISSRNAKNKAYTFSNAPNGNSVRVTTAAFADGAGDALTPFFSAFGANFEIRPRCTATNTQTTLDVSVIVDRSGSMKFAANESSGSGTPASQPAGWSWGDPAPPNSRWLDLAFSVTAFCEELDATGKIEKVGLVSYASDVTREVDLTDDYTGINAALSAISQSFNGGATSVGDGIVEGIAAVTHPSLARPWASNALVLMSDGIHNTGTDPLVAIQGAIDRQIPIYTVSFSNEADQLLMREIADRTGGKHYHANTSLELAEAFRKIARRLPSMLTE